MIFNGFVIGTDRDLTPIEAYWMLYGFAAAIIAGFLLTAVQNWSGIPGLPGPSQ